MKKYNPSVYTCLCILIIIQSGICRAGSDSDSGFSPEILIGDQEIPACVHSTKGKLRIVNNASECKPKEQAILLNKKPSGQVIIVDSNGSKLPGDILATGGYTGFFVGEELYYLQVIRSRIVGANLYFDAPGCAGSAYVAVDLPPSFLGNQATVGFDNKIYVPEPGSEPVMFTPQSFNHTGIPCIRNFSELMVKPAIDVLDLNEFVPPFSLTIQDPSLVIGVGP